ncbi:MAG: hypothetical protein RL754_998 [Bacteroidota bacterium]
MAKYSLLPEQLIHEGTISQGNFFVPEMLPEERILRSHDANYWKALRSLTLDKKAQRKIGFPLSQELVDRERIICGGTVQNTEFALQYGCSMNIAGGTHHAYYSHGEGFCIFNDIIIGAHHLIDQHGFERILVVDLDVHQGNGTAVMAQGDDRIFTFSMHGDKNWPYKKEKSDLDIALADQTDDRTYLSTLDRNLGAIIDQFEPQFIFFQSGVDVLAEDKLGRLGLTVQGCRERDLMVLERCARNEIPVVINMGGGYSPAIRTIIEAHANTFRVAANLFS